MKKIFKKVFHVLLFVMLLAGVFLGYQYIQYKNKEVNDLQREIQAQNDADLQKELLDRQIENAKNYVNEINNNVALTVLRTSGKITLSHDKTPQNNKWTEWLFNSDIKVYANYKTAFTIETDKIQSEIGEDGTVTLTYDPRDIELSFIDITDFTTSANKSIFGSSYSPEQVAACESIARHNIQEKTNNKTNQKQAESNLLNYLNGLADSYGIKINIVEK